MEEKNRKTCGNCFTVQPHSETHVVCLNDKCRCCGCLKSVNSAGCKQWRAAS